MTNTNAHHRTARFAVLALLAAAGASAQDLKLPNKDGSVKFAVLGDWGTGAILLAIAVVAFAWIARSFREEPTPPAAIGVSERIAAD